MLTLTIIGIYIGMITALAASVGDVLLRMAENRVDLQPTLRDVRP